VTHQHPDHLDLTRLPDLLAQNRTAVLLAEPGAAGEIRNAVDDVEVDTLVAGETRQVGAATVTGVGVQHARIHDSVPRIGNTGMRISAAGEPTFFHPGDAYDAEPGGVDVLALPLTAPWTDISGTIAFLHKIAPRWAIPIHEAVLSVVGRGLYLSLVERLGPECTSVADLGDRHPWGVPADPAPALDE
jgi:L-ascorbate metabolism protein UlaG (beta-lactamase superfamily)